MSIDSRTVILQALATFGEVHNRKVSTELIQVWINLFEHKDTENLQRAFSEHLERSSYFPKPADINALISGSFDSQSLVAWTSVTAAMAALGSYASVRFEDPHIVPIISSLGGWPFLCGQTHDDLIWIQKAFERAYQDALTRTPAYGPGIPHLAGTTELGNAAYDDAPLIYLVTTDGSTHSSTPSGTPALVSPHGSDTMHQAVHSLATDKATKG
jgi:hypothetical protein